MQSNEGIKIRVVFMPRNLCLKEDFIKVLSLYCLMPFGQMHSKNPKIIALSQEIGRTPGSVAFKMVNFASLDPTISQLGMRNFSALDKAVWDEFFEQIKENSTSIPLGQGGFSEPSLPKFDYEDRQGLDVAQTSTRRVNQGFFRSMILVAYENRCAISRINDPSLLVASHIIPWADSPSLRMEPRNGLCLNFLHDRAFECGLIAIDETFSVITHPFLRARIRSLMPGWR